MIESLGTLYGCSSDIRIVLPEARLASPLYASLRMSLLYYDSDDALPLSPPLLAVEPKSTPSPSPPPFIQKPEFRSKRKTQPIQGDSVLISQLGPNYPEISQEAGRRALYSASQSEYSESDSEMEDPTGNERTSNHEVSGAIRLSHPKPPHRRDSYDSEVRSKATNSGANVKPKEGSEPPTKSIRLQTSTEGAVPTFARAPQRMDDASQKLELQTPQSAHDSVINGNSPSATSPGGRSLTVPLKNGQPETLPPLQNPLSPASTVGSPNQTLPSFREFVTKASEKDNAEEGPRTNGYHRASISGPVVSTAISPIMRSRHYSLSTVRSPSSQLSSLTHPSPVSANSDISPHDPFLKSSTFNAHSSMINRRTSQASENGPPQFPGIRSGSVSDALSPTSQVSPNDSAHRMSIDGAIRPILPPPNPTVQTVPINNPAGYRCDHPGCNAAPFTTQYLLNSHANVHSSNRPHYCPVPGCPRGEKGKGFKRKNEMIRHGLVHDSPGYVCPFCPDREHRYPRPDNLQRHVRVHHVDKDKDDQLLREVLAQRPEGGSRGRRRRGT